MFLIDLFEARRETAMQTLSQYMMRPNMFVTFVDIEKIGINPRSEHTDTPSGIYAYPLKEAYSMMETKTIRFAGDRRYICLFEGRGNLLDLQAYSYSNYEHDVENLMSQWTLIDPKNEDFALNMLVAWDSDMFSQDSRPGSAIWRMVWRMASRADRIYNREAMVIANSIYRKLGYNGLVDHGEGIIYANEPAQALFLSRDAIQVVEFLINDHLPGHRAAFSGRNERKMRGYKQPRDAEDYPINKSE